MTDPLSSRSPQQPSRARWGAFIVVLAAGFMTLLDVSIVNVALPAIETGLAATPSHIQWIVAGYSLAFGLVLVPAGRLGDIVGRRRMFLIGVIGFVLSSAVAGFSTSADMLAVTRLVQGVFAGIMNPQVIALIQELFQGSDRARAFGHFGMTIGVSTAIGPLLGGVLVSGLGPDLGWRSVFLINVPIGLVVIPLAWKWLPSRTVGLADGEEGADTSVGIDMGGLVLIGGIVLAIMWPFVTASSSAKGLAGAPWWLLAVAAVLAVILVLWERWRDSHGKSAVLPEVLVHNTGFVLGASLGAVYFAGFTGIFIVLTLYYQQGLGAPAWVAGLAQMPFALASAVSAAKSGRRVTLHGRRVVVEGLALMVVSLIGIVLLAAFAPQRVAEWGIPVLLLPAGWAGGSVISPNQSLTLADVPNQQAGTASGLLQTLQRLGGSVGLALLTTVFFSHVATSGGGSAGYAQALAISMMLTVVMIVSALVIGIIDSRRRGA